MSEGGERVGGLPARFVKMSGTGNDFIVFLERIEVRDREAEVIRRLCARGTGVGADGVLFVHAETTGDGPPRVVADYFNADGGAASFCANGTRCAARLAHIVSGAPSEMTVVTGWGPIGATVHADGRVTLRIPAPVTESRTLDSLDEGGLLEPTATEVSVGVPHLVVFTAGGPLEDLDLSALGPRLRRHQNMPEGANANFIAVRGSSRLAIRTWERGVEAETLSCGSGVIAAAVVAGLRGHASPIHVLTRSGEKLVVSFRLEEGIARDVTLTGDARIVYEGVLPREEWERVLP